MLDDMGAKKEEKAIRLYGKVRAAVEGFRQNPFFQELERKKAKGRILGFVKGLRFSSALIYAIRDSFRRETLKADWGHLMDEGGNFVSPECDIIIYEGKYFDRWNGEPEPVMDFKFIEANKAKAVISCKSFIKTADVEEEYCRRLLEYVDKVWFFAECCGPKSFDNIKNTAVKYGYEDFWCLYTQNGAGELTYLEDVWFDFFQKIESL